MTACIFSVHVLRINCFMTYCKIKCHYFWHFPYAAMGLFLHCLIFCTLCFIQAEVWKTYQPVMHDVTFMKSGTEFTRIVDSSPTGVLRALKNIHARLYRRPVSIVTEKLFENVVKGWIHQFKAKIAKLTVLKHHIRVYNLSYRIIHDREHEYEFDSSSRIFLLTPEKLKHHVTDFHVNPNLLQHISHNATTDIIIGTCLPRFFKNKFGINIFIPVETRHWIYPSNSESIQRDRIKRSTAPYFVQRTSIRSWRVISLEYHMNLCHVNNQTRDLYGSLQGFSIRMTIESPKDLLGFSNVKDGKPAGFLPNLLEYVSGYFQLTFFWGYIDEKGNAKTNYIHNWRDDFPEITSILHHESGYQTWPQLFRDGLTAIAKLKTRNMTLARLMSLFKFQVWIATIVTLCLLNLGFYFAFDGSPSLKHHPKFMNKSMSKLMRILVFDSLIRFQEEWSAGPTKSVRILLMAFNIYLFLTLNAFLAIFSVQILSRNYFPLNKFSDICRFRGKIYMDLDVYFDLNSHEEISPQCVFKIWYYTSPFYNYFNSVPKYQECLTKDSCSILTHSKKGNLAINHYIGVSYLKKPEIISGMSIPFHTERIFENSFTHVVLGLRENGILQILQERTFKLYSRSNITAEAITFSETWLTLSILAIGNFAAVLIVVAEIIIHKMYKEKQTMAAK